MRKVMLSIAPAVALLPPVAARAPRPPRHRSRRRRAPHPRYDSGASEQQGDGLERERRRAGPGAGQRAGKDALHLRARQGQEGHVHGLVRRGLAAAGSAAGASKAAASGAVNASLLGSDPDPTGGRVVTYAGWPLYTLRHRFRSGQRARPGPQPERWGLVRDLGDRQGGHGQRLRIGVVPVAVLSRARV